jgi:HJR/Mrr/RecB family endonuclease
VLATSPDLINALALAEQLIPSSDLMAFNTGSSDWQSDLEAAPIAQELVAEHADLVDRFLSIAERTVSRLDEYGDENWKTLDREIFRCIEKITEKEDGSVTTTGSPREYRTKGYGGYRVLIAARLKADTSALYQELFAILEHRFQTYHTGRANSKRTLAEIDTMTGEEFEGYVMRVLKQHRCTVSSTPKTGDQGADIIARLDKRVIIIQAKRSISPIGNRAVQEVVAALAYYDGSEGWVVTNSSFTQAARELADRNGIRLISGAELMRIGDFLGCD